MLIHLFYRRYLKINVIHDHLSVYLSNYMVQLKFLIGIPLINTTGTTSGAGTAYPSWAPEFTPGF